MNTQTQADPNSKQSRKKAAAQAHNEALRANLVEDVPVTPEQRVEFERISTKLYKATSKWQKMLKTGIAEAVTVEQEEYVPEEKDAEGNVTQKEETRKVQVPVMNVSKKGHMTTVPLNVMRQFTPATLVTFLQANEKQYDDFMAALEKIKEQRRLDAEKKQADALLVQQLQNTAGGGVLA